MNSYRWETFFHSLNILNQRLACLFFFSFGYFSYPPFLRFPALIPIPVETDETCACAAFFLLLLRVWLLLVLQLLQSVGCWQFAHDNNKFWAQKSSSIFNQFPLYLNSISFDVVILIKVCQPLTTWKQQWQIKRFKWGKQKILPSCLYLFHGYFPPTPSVDVCVSSAAYKSAYPDVGVTRCAQPAVVHVIIQLSLHCRLQWSLVCISPSWFHFTVHSGHSTSYTGPTA